MIPFFSSHYSGGLFTFETPEKAKKHNKSSLFAVCQENEIESPFVVEKTMTGFMELFKVGKECGINPRFGLKMPFVHEVSEENKFNSHKVIVFIKNSQGYKDLIRVHNYAHKNDSSLITPKNLELNWSENLSLVIPFYDSYIFRNKFYNSACLPEFGQISPLHTKERNGLPFDTVLESFIPGDAVESKTIYYETRQDFKKWLTYKCSLNYSNKGKNRSLEEPNFDHCHSKEFSVESYLETKKQ